jgi:hypothetical protein
MLAGYDEDASDAALNRAFWVTTPPSHPNVTFVMTGRAPAEFPTGELQFANVPSTAAWATFYPTPVVVDDVLVRTVLQFNVTWTDTRGASSQSTVKIYIMVNVDAGSTSPVLESVRYNSSLTLRSLPTSGGLFSILGRNFASLSGFALVARMQPSSSDPTASRGPAYANCSVVDLGLGVPPTEIACTAPPGYGANHSLSVANAAAPDTPVAIATRAILFSYDRPVVTGVRPLRAVNGSNITNPNALNTAGGDYFYVIGRNLWAPGAPAEALRLYF